MISKAAVTKIRGNLPEQKHGFLQFSQKLDYGLFLLIELAKKQPNGLPLSLRTVTEENRMSFFFMQKVAFELRKAGLIAADRGKNGGYRLAKPSSQIALKAIIETLEGPITVMNCFIPRTAEHSNAACSREPKCQMRHGLFAVNQAIVNIFTQTTLLHLLESPWKKIA